MSILNAIWIDPVWSKVIAAGILSALAGVASLFKKVSGKSRRFAQIALVVGICVVIAGLLRISLSAGTAAPAGVTLISVRQAARSAVFGMDYIGRDEVVAKARGTFAMTASELKTVALVPFWRQATGFETNWHVGKRRVGEDYQLAMLEGESAGAGTWEFPVGGIELEKSYSGTVSLVIIALRRDAVERDRSTWLADDNGWGFEQLPDAGRIAISAPASFETKQVRP
jgi:hypothetical protein